MSIAVMEAHNRHPSSLVEDNPVLDDDAAPSGAAARARTLRDQATAFRRLADLEFLPENRKLLLRAAERYDEIASREQRVADSQLCNATHRMHPLPAEYDAAAG